jgi:hypothetical protein
VTASSEIDALDPVDNATFELSTGLVVAIEPLKTRQFFRLFRIITHGAPAYLEGSLTGLFEGDSEEVTTRLVAMIVFSVPEAEEQTMDFLASMVRPVGLEPDNGNKAAAMRNDTRWNEVEAAMVNPSMDDTLGIVEMIIRRESKDLAALGKRLVSMLETATKTGQQNATSPKVTKASTRKASSDPLPEPSTSSLPNTDGTTSESSD